MPHVTYRLPLLASALIISGLAAGLCRGEGALSPEAAKTVKELVGKLNSEESEVVSGAYENLLKMGDRGAPIVLSGYASANLTGKGMILKLLSSFQAKAALDLLLDVLVKEEEGLLRAEAARALLKSAPEDPRVLEKVAEVARTDLDEYVQLVIINTMTDNMSRESIPYVIGLLQGEAPDMVRRAACQSLKRCSREKFKCDHDEWSEWWNKHQDLFKGCGRRAESP